MGLPPITVSLPPRPAVAAVGSSASARSRKLFLSLQRVDE
jgi:hypothetical protein